MFSNEAGMGSAPIAAPAPKNDQPLPPALGFMTGTVFGNNPGCSLTGLGLGNGPPPCLLNI
ncbi:alanine:cation symporter family protein [Neisseria meningitidis]|uniref:alanine:cation symporter family protein n=1 Tax=Neisseria meningitidis TaxID=487 RepID=UPI00387ADD6D